MKNLIDREALESLLKYCGPILECIGVKTGECYDGIFKKINSKICNIYEELGKMQHIKVIDNSGCEDGGFIILDTNLPEGEQEIYSDCYPENHHYKALPDCGGFQVVDCAQCPDPVVIFEYCPPITNISFEDDPECPTGGYKVYKNKNLPTEELLYSTCNTNITFKDNPECTDGCGFIVKQNGTEIESFCCKYLQFKTNDCGGFTMTNPNDNTTFNYCPSKHQNTVYVDGTYGDDNTGQRENVNKPFQSIVMAAYSAISGDTVHVRSGIYTILENSNTGYGLVLKDGVNLYFENVTINAYDHFIGDNSSKVKCNITGNLKINGFGNSYAFEIFGVGSDVYIDIIGIEGNNTYFNVQGDDNERETKANIKVEYLEGLELDYGLSARGNTVVNMNVSSHVICAETGSNNYGLRVVDIQNSTVTNNFKGKIFFKCPYVYVGNNYNSDDDLVNQGFYNDFGVNPYTNPSNSLKEVGEVSVEVNRIESNQQFVGRACISKFGNTRANFKIEEMTCLSDGISVGGDREYPDTYGYFYFEGNVRAGNTALRACSQGKVIIKNSIFEGYTTQYPVYGDPNWKASAVIFGYGQGGVPTNYKANMSIVDTSIVSYGNSIKDGGVSGNNAFGSTLLLTYGFENGMNVLLKDVGIYGEANDYSIGFDGLTASSIQIFNVVSNVLTDSALNDVITNNTPPALPNFVKSNNYKPTNLL